jgi:phosphoglycolate phosphatase
VTTAGRAGIAGPPVSWALFDLDGCLLDSSRAIPAAINVGLEAVAVPRRPAMDLQWCIGPPLAASFASILAEHGRHGDDHVATAVRAYRAAYPDIAVAVTTVVPGVLDVLAGAGQRRAIVTSKPAAQARPLAAAMGLLDHVEEVFGPSLDLAVEPKEATLGRALGVLGIRDPATAVMVGDRHHDVDAGRARGTATVGVTWGAGDRGELEAARADHVVGLPADLAEVLARMGTRAD